MITFEEELLKGNFVICECKKCETIVWPPSDTCNVCFNHVIWRSASKIGKIIEFSKKEDSFFCIGEFENKIRILGTLDMKKSPNNGMSIRLTYCGIKDGNYAFTFVPNHV